MPTLISHAAIAAVLLCPLAATAAEVDPGNAVDQVVVTAKSLEETLPQELSRYGSDVAIITAAQVKNGGFVDTTQALQTLTPGLYIAPSAGPFSYVDLSLQGSRTQDVLWTVDGVRINNRLYNSTTPVDTLPASMIERVEVLKGGQGLFYGTQASAGVINVVTRAFSDTPGGELTIGGGGHDTVHADGYVRGALGRHKIVAYASKDESDGYQQYDVFQPSATDRKRGYDVVTLGAKYGFDFTETLRLSANWQHTDARLDNLSPRLVRKSYNDRDEDIVSGRLDYTPDGPAQFFLKGYLHDWDTTYENVQNTATGPKVIYPAGTYWGYRDYGASALVKLNLNKGFEYELGYDFQNFKGRDEVLLIEGKTEQVHALIAQVRTTPDLLEHALLTAGLRYNHGQGADTTIWTVSGRYDLTPAVYVEGVGGTSFLLPDAEQLFAFDPDSVHGNPDLKAEESKNLNLAIGGTWGDSVSWKLTGFGRRIDNLISDVYDDPAYPEGLYVNVDGLVKVSGAEAAVQARLGQDFSLNASYTHTRSRDEGSSLQRDRTPVDFAKASLDYAPAGQAFGANLSVNWTGDVYQTVSGFGRLNYGDYTVVDLAAHVFLDGQAHHHRLGARVQNLFDTDYAARLGSAVVDSGTSRFLYRNLGVPRTASVRYTYAF
ncbi:TonB-dependent receptor plug domain-containing protein [Caulobacter soli]|uniref:TonB-dependent receptor plug domain-containing protein n=1 Tax=Caulobacter soli TaxID=2708539 RepID=UPI00196A79BF|nr:TonB-dependent receptor [Caulobacter soli]